MIIQTILKPAVGVALRWYYRSITVANGARIPERGPILLAVNHPNALVDALVIGYVAPRPVNFTAKATLFASPLAAKFFRAAGVVPLRRASDELAKSRQASGGSAASAPTANAIARDTDAAPQSMSSAALDAARNAASFAAVADALARGGAVVIFPEGKSHDEPRLAPLRTGMARMALMARDERAVRGLLIVPVGLLFEKKEEPRTRILLQVGQPVCVDDFSGDNQVAAITDAVAQRLQQVTLNFETPDDAARINAAGETLAALLAPSGVIDHSEVSLQDKLAMVRRTDRVNRALSERPDPVLALRMQQFEDRLARFSERLAALRIRPDDIAIQPGAEAGARLVVRESIRAALLLPVTLWGRLTHFIPIRIARALAMRSVRNRDEPAMRTIVFGTLVVLLTYVALTTVVAVVFGGWWALLFLLSLVPSASSDLRYGDRLRRLRARARAWSLFRQTPSLQRELLAEADWLRTEGGAIERIALGA